MSESSADEMLGTPPDIAEAASIVKNDLLPDKSRKRYERERSLFRIWCKKKNVTTLTENVMLAYFLEKSEVMKSSTLWSIYSMLKASLILSDNVDISKSKENTVVSERNFVHNVAGIPLQGINLNNCTSCTVNFYVNSK